MRLIKVFIIFLVVLAVVLLAAPVAGKWYVKTWLEEKGFSPVIKHMSFNYVLGRVSVTGANISKAGMEAASVFAMELDFNVPELFKGKVVFDKIAVDNLHFMAEKKGSQWQVAGLPLNQWLSGTGSHDVTIKRLEAVNTDVCTPDRDQCLRIEDLSTGNVQWQHANQSWAFSHRTPLVVSKVFLQDRSNSSSVLYFELLQLQHSHFSNELYSIKDVNLRNFQLVESQAQATGKELTPYQAQLGELTLGSVELHFGQTRGIKIKGMNLVSFRQSIQRQAGAKNTWLRRANEWFPGVMGLWNDIDFSKPGATFFNLIDFEMQGGKLTWRDETVSPPAIEQISQIKLTVDAIDSDKTGESQIKMDAKLGDIGAIKFDSNAQFFTGSPLFNVTGYTHGLDLANISGYSHKIFNQRVKAGVIDVSFNVGVTGDRVAGQSVWRITGLATEAQNAPMGTSFKKLADHNNSVEFDIPVGLSIAEDANPVAELGRALNNTLSNKARGMPEKSNAVKARPVVLDTYPPIFFAANEIDPAQLDLPRIPDIVADVKTRGQKSLMVCPVATLGEWAVMFNGGKQPAAGTEPTPEQAKLLLDLTARRGQVLSRLFTSKGLNPSRIIICGPSIDMSKSGPSMATLAI